jgi:hypothetical protein
MLAYSFTVSLTVATSTETSQVGSIMSQIEVAVFIIFGSLSTFHPLLTKYFSTGPKARSESRSFDSCGFDPKRADSSAYSGTYERAIISVAPVTV